MRNLIKTCKRNKKWKLKLKKNSQVVFLGLARAIITPLDDLDDAAEHDGEQADAGPARRFWVAKKLAVCIGL